MIIQKPDAEELSVYYQSYLKYVTEDDMLEALKIQKERSQSFLNSIPESKSMFAYESGKWKLKEVVGHVCDTERILSYRALRISRNDRTPLSGFEEKDYVPNSNYSSRKLANIAEEYRAVGDSTIALFSNMSEEMYERKGIANQLEVSVRAILFFILSHERHHMKVIRDRYLL